MLGDYILHHPITDFPVALLVVAAIFQIACSVLKRPRWQVIADAMLVVGFLGSLAAVGTGLWLVAASDHGHSKALSIHHWFAYSALGVAALATLALWMSKRRPELAKVKIIALVISAGLVSAAGFFGGKMAHPVGEQAPHTHADDGTRMQTNSAAHEHGSGEHRAHPEMPAGSSNAHGDQQHSMGSTPDNAAAKPMAGSGDGHMDHHHSTGSDRPAPTGSSDGHGDHQHSTGSSTSRKPTPETTKPTTNPAAPAKQSPTKPTTPTTPTPTPSTEPPPTHEHH